MTRQLEIEDAQQKIHLNNGTDGHRIEEHGPEFVSKPKFWRYLVKHYAVSSQVLALLIIFIALWGILYSLLPDFAAPDSTFMRIIFLVVGAQLCGILASFLWLPDMLGMLFWGVLYTNLGWADFGGYERLEAFLRDMALINIMLLAGLGLNMKALKQLFRPIMQVVLVPTIFETTAITVASHYFLNLPWLWGVLLGLVITAISPNVVITVLLRLKEERLGLNKGIHTLIIAMTSCNDVIAIFLFGVMLGVIFSTGSLTTQLLQGPIGIVVGVVYGILCGNLLLIVPSMRSKYANGLKFAMIVVAGTLCVLGSKAIGYPSAGALGCVTTAFVAITGWNKQKKYSNNEVTMYLDLLWKFLKPVSFSLIGKEVNFKVLEGDIVLYGLVSLAIGVAFRLVTNYFSAYGAGLNWRERVYVTLSGFPKATVQASLGPMALDKIREICADPTTCPDDTRRANIILIVSVLAIILTAPLGALLMIRLAPRLLQRQTAAEARLEGAIV